MGTRTITRSITRTITGIAVLAGLSLGAGPVPSPAEAAAQRTLAGANDWSCEPTSAHPSPVVLVHGTFGDSMNLLQRLSWRMRTAGYCVFALDYGNRATGPIERSAQQLKTFVTRC